MEQISLPKLYCPFAPAVNAHAEDVQEETLRWASSLGLLPDERFREAFRAAAIGELAARFHPFAPRDELHLISDFYAWMFLQDDHRDESEVGQHPGDLFHEDRRSLEVLRGDEPSTHDGPPVHALRDLRERLAFRMPGPMWMRRFVRSVESYFDATVWEATNRTQSIVPDPDTYLRMRPLTSGLAIDDELIELGDEVRLFGGGERTPDGKAPLPHLPKGCLLG